MNLLFHEIVPPAYKASVREQLFSENVKRSRVLILFSLSLNVLFGIGSDVITFLKGGVLAPTLPSALLIHTAIIIFQAIAFFYIRHLAAPKHQQADKSYPERSISIFTVVYGCIYILLTTLLTLNEEFNSARVLIFTIALMFISVFLLLKPAWFCIIFSSGLALLVYIIFLKNESIPQAFSTSALAIVVTVSGYVIAVFLFNTFVQRTISAETIRLQQQTLEERTTEKDAILSIVAHDLRTPVTNIDQLARLIEINDPGDPENEQLLSHIKESCLQAYQIIDDLIDNSDSKLVDQNRTLTDLQQLFRHTLALNDKRFRKKNISVQVHDWAEPLLVNINPNKFTRVFDNLLSNAAKFTHNNGHVTIRFVQKSDSIEMIVEDDGIGIPADIRGHLFKPFSQARRRGINGEETTGLGLSIVKNIVELHGGSVKVFSKEGMGTTFTISIPLPERL